VTEARFRTIALAKKGAVEGAHRDHPDFRVEGRIFATLHQDGKYGMVKSTPEQQQAFIRDQPAAFTPEDGAWGRQGCTAVLLEAVDEDALGDALTLAWRNAAERRAPKKRARRPNTGSQT